MILKATLGIIDDLFDNMVTRVTKFNIKGNPNYQQTLITRIIKYVYDFRISSELHFMV